MNIIEKKSTILNLLHLQKAIHLVQKVKIEWKNVKYCSEKCRINKIKN